MGEDYKAISKDLRKRLKEKIPGAEFNQIRDELRAIATGGYEYAECSFNESMVFQDFINSLVMEEAKISLNKKVTTQEEKKTLKGFMEGVKNKTRIFLIAECDNKIVGITSIELGKWRKNHVGTLGIMIKQGYRGIGLGKYLMKEILKLSKRALKPKPKIISLSVYPGNKPAINLYRKTGFKEVARIPKQIQYKGKLLEEVIMLLYL